MSFYIAIYVSGYISIVLFIFALFEKVMIYGDDSSTKCLLMEATIGCHFVVPYVNSLNKVMHSQHNVMSI